MRDREAAMIFGYHVEVRPLSARLGGGFVAYAPALTGCVADGESRDEALRNLEDAMSCWLAAARAQRRPIPRAELRLHA
jgi:predicted RNase H-like HicB family nuclease